MCLQERMKKYAELDEKDILHLADVQGIYADLEAVVRALEMAREAFRDILHYDPTPTFQGGVAYRAIETIDQTLGKAGYGNE